jgi:adenylate kinase family enzyme
VSAPEGPSTGSDLAAALASLLEVAQAAGVAEDAARAEGESLAATVAEAAVGAWTDWARQTGGDRGAEDFSRAASQGRRWRSTPTPALAELARTHSPQATAYAKALVGVCTAATTLGEPNARVVGNASTASAAQLGAFEPSSASSPGTAPATGAVQRSAAAGARLDELSTGVRGLWDDVMAELGRVRGRLAESRTERPGFTLDLGDADPWGPGAFPGLGDARATGSSGPGQPVLSGSGSEPVSAPGTADGMPGAVPTAPDPAAAAPEVASGEPAEDPRTVEELLAELDALIGLTSVKAEVHRQVAVLEIEAKRAKAGLKTPSLTRHLVFVGNPGTGKTTVARLVGGIYRALGLLSKGQLVEVDRSELVAGYLGQTAMKTAEVVAKADGGVLFIDEAYSLAGDQYGQEAVDTLVKEMEDKREDLVVIVAGYPVPMEFFIAQNPGLASRFRTTITFADYTDDELVAIFTSLANKADYDVSEEVATRFRELLAEVERGPSFGNGRFARNVFEGAIGRHAWRLRSVEEPTVAQLRGLEPEDLDAADDAAPGASSALSAPTAPEEPSETDDPEVAS